MKKRMIIVGIVTFVAAACMVVIRLYGRKTMV